MTPALFLVGDLAAQLAAHPDLVELTGDEARHAAVVRRVEPGETVLVADGGGTLATTTVLAADRTSVRLAVVDVRRLEPPRPRMVVVQALAKGDRSELAVELMTELGVDVVVPWAAERSIAQWRGEKVARGVQRWQRTATEAAKQSRRPRIPEIGDLAGTAAVCGLLAEAATPLVLHEDARTALAGLVPAGDGDLVLVVGPEGGISEAESSAFAAAGARPVRLGPEVVRTSTAGAAALAVLSAAAGRWATPPATDGPDLPPGGPT